MTEKDTFDALRRVPIKEMIQLWKESAVQSWEDANAPVFFEQHGWEGEKFRRAWIAYNGGSYENDRR